MRWIFLLLFFVSVNCIAECWETSGTLAWNSPESAKITKTIEVRVWDTSSDGARSLIVTKKGKPIFSLPLNRHVSLIFSKSEKLCIVNDYYASNESGMLLGREINDKWQWYYVTNYIFEKTGLDKFGHRYIAACGELDETKVRLDSWCYDPLDGESKSYSLKNQVFLINDLVAHGEKYEFKIPENQTSVSHSK